MGETEGREQASPRRRRREAYLRECGVGREHIAGLLDYGEALVVDGQVPESGRLPLEDEPFVEAWASYVAEAESDGAWAVLSRRLVQLQFPIDAAVAESEAYLAATRRGVMPAVPRAPQVVAPEGILLELHPTPAGRIPVITIQHRDDFVTIVRALLRKNRPEVVPDSMGASMVAGYTNWDRVGRYRQQWEKANPFGDWAQAFREMAQDKSLYQDRFILLSSGAYSGIGAACAQMTEADWNAASIRLRREHECVHYFTRRVLGSMRNSLLDELVADAVATRIVAGSFRSDWLKAFFGIEGWPEYRPGGRLENYVPGNLSGCFEHLTGFMVRAIANVERINADEEMVRWPDLVFMLALCACSLDELARPDGFDLLRSAGQSIASTLDCG